MINFVGLFLKKAIKVIKYIVFALLGLWLLFVALPVIIFQVPSVQRYIAANVSENLSNRLNVPVEVGNVNIDWLSRLVLKDISLNDQNGALLFKAKTMSASFKLLPALRKQWVFTSIRLHGFTLNLTKDTPDDRLNLQFVIDAFSSADSTKQSNIDLQMHAVLINGGNVNFDVTNSPAINSKFDSKHINISNLNGKLSLDVFNRDSINAQIRKLSFDEHSGFSLSRMSLNLTGNKDSLSIDDLDIRLPHTKLLLEKASIRFDEIDSISQFSDRAPVYLRIAPSQISPKDFSAFAPVLQRFPDILQFSAKISGFINDLSLDGLVVQQTGVLSVSGKLNVKEIMQPEKTYLFANAGMNLTASGLEKIMTGLQEQPVPLPYPVAQLGDLQFTGEIAGFLDNLVAYGSLQSEIGSLTMDMLFGYDNAENVTFFAKGKAMSSELLIDRLFEGENPYGSVRFDIDIDAIRAENGKFSGNVQADIYDFDFNKYTYENISLSGGFKENEFNGSIQIDDINGKLKASGLFKNDGANSVFNFSAGLSDFKADKLNLTDRYINPNLSCKIEADFKGNHIDNFEGFINVDNLSFQTQSDSLSINTFHIKTEGDATDRTLAIQSDFLNGEITGAYSFSTLLSSFVHTSQHYLPSLSAALPENHPTQDNIFSLKLTFQNTETFSKTLQLPVTILKQGEITGHYNNHDNLFRLDALFPAVKFGQALFEPLHIVCDNQSDMIKLQTTINHLHKNGSHNLINMNVDAIDDQISALFTLKNDRDNSIDVNLSTSTLFVAENEPGNKKQLRTEITLNPTDITLKDSIWNLEPASITILNGSTHIDNFYISKQNQYLRINGAVSAQNPRESLLVDLNDIELSYIFDIINKPILQFGGKAFGVIRLTDLFGSRILQTDELIVQNFSFNQVVQGKLSLYSQWDNEEEGILLMGTIYKTDSVWTDFEGFIYPMGEKEGLSLNFDATDFDLALLHPYVDAFSEIVEGRGYGKLRFFGSFSNPTFEGNVYVQDGRIGVDFLHTDYTFSDSIFVYPASIQGNNITIHDKYGNTGNLTFNITHTFLRDIYFDINMQTPNLLIYDTPERVNPQIYGVVYGDGNVRIEGTEQFINVQATVRSNSGTAVGFNFMNNYEVDNYDFIVFKEPVSADEASGFGSEQSLVAQISNSQDNGTDYRINCMIEITPDAHIELMMDPSTGDKIKGTGSGDIRVDYGSKTDLAMFGGYTIQNGTYNFSLQQLIHKDFQLSDGSRVDFSGDPLEAILNLNAVYTLTANVEDLEMQLAKESFRTSVPVNCILNLNGRLQSPDITFDMKFPNSTSELERQVKSVINTDEMMMRQIIYLLVLNRFYTPDYSQGASTNEFNRMASSALSAQLSSLLNSLTDKVQIGTNIRTRQDGITDTEVEMLLSSQLLNNRLLFNGNFGYKNNSMINNTFIGEFDLEYKLIPSGEIRLKAYNHANDMYQYTKKAQTRQGVGLMYNKDFNSLTELFRRRRKADQ